MENSTENTSTVSILCNVLCRDGLKHLVSLPHRPPTCLCFGKWQIDDNCSSLST
uniref:Uncharacterized protein n=1 Tax=Anguilla anguilla TaxID=7936 RepID=A0A0E9V7N1_ANGAN